jgi:acetyl esterase/lipase
MKLLASALLLAAAAPAAEYRIDCADPKWKSIDAVSAIELKPGDRVLLKSGCRWQGTLKPKGSGTEEAPLRLDRYGEGPLPAIEGNGAEAALLLRNQQYWEIGHLELTNDAPSPGLRRGLLIRAENAGAIRHIHISGLDIHNVRGQLGADMVSKCTGGIGLEAVTRLRPSHFEDILIENSRIHALDNMGIYLNTDAGPHPRDPQWAALHHSGIVVRGNRLDDIGKNAICIRASLNTLIERNTVTGAAARYHGNAIYVFGSKDAVIQYNEVSHTNHLEIEGAAFDSDYNSEGTVIQYNYSHDNGGGLADICNNPDSKAPRGFNDGTIIRFNVSRNEGYRVIAFDGPATNTQIYNNTLIVPRGATSHIVEFDLFGNSPGYADKTSIRNNIVVNEGDGVYLLGQATHYSFEGNCFAGKNPPAGVTDARRILADPMLLNPASTAEGLDALAAFHLKPGSPCAAAGAFPSPNYQVIDGLQWAAPQGFPLKADLYLPEGKGPFPAIVFLHGGGFTDRNRAQLRRQAAHMASLGMVGFAIEYRVAKEATYPAAVSDAKAAVRWLRANAAKYNIDERYIFAVGSSAGGHLAAMLALTGGDPAFEGDACCKEFSSRITAAVAFNPVLDLTDMAHRESLVTRFLGGKCEAKIEVCKQASPVSHVSASAAPILIMHGTADETVPYRQAEAMVAKLKAAGAAVEFFTAPEGAHTFWSTPEWYGPSEKAMEEFLGRHARP